MLALLAVGGLNDRGPGEVVHVWSGRGVVLSGVQVLSLLAVEGVVLKFSERFTLLTL